MITISKTTKNTPKEIKFTFGFEIEGVFSEKLYSSAVKYCQDYNENKPLRKNIHFSWQSDGSVQSNQIISANKPLRTGDIGYLDDEEVAVGVFSDMTDVIKAIELFKNGENYFNNSSCGFHLHVATSDNETKAKLLSRQFIKQLENFGKNELCLHVRARLENSRYCQPYSNNFDTLYYNVISGSKFHSVRNHLQNNTLEFRLLSPCEHKIDNIKRLWAFIVEFIQKNKAQLKDNIMLEWQPPQKQVKLYHNAKNDNQVISEIIQLKKINKLNLSIPLVPSEAQRGDISTTTRRRRN